jgi:hypothetical protein
LMPGHSGSGKSGVRLCSGRIEYMAIKMMASE